MAMTTMWAMPWRFRKDGPTLVAVYELAMLLAGQGAGKVELGNPGGTIDLGSGVSVSFVKAFHSSSTSVDGKTVYLGNPCGVVIEGLGKTVYHMGNTEIFGDMALIAEIFGPKIGFVPIGDHFTMGAKRRRCLQKVLPIRRRCAHPLRNLSDYRSGPGQIRRCDGGPKCSHPGNRQTLRDFTGALIRSTRQRAVR